MKLVLEYTLKMGNGSNKHSTSAKAARTKPEGYKIPTLDTLCIHSVNVNSGKCESSRYILDLARTH